MIIDLRHFNFIIPITYDLTPPAIIPSMIFSSKIMTNTIIGNKITQPIALNKSHGTSYAFALGNVDMPTGISNLGYMILSMIIEKKSGMKNSFKQFIKLMMHIVAIAGFNKGIIT